MVSTAAITHPLKAARRYAASTAAAGELAEAEAAAEEAEAAAAEEAESARLSVGQRPQRRRGAFVTEVFARFCCAGGW